MRAGEHRQGVSILRAKAWIARRPMAPPGVKDRPLRGAFPPLGGAVAGGCRPAPGGRVFPRGPEGR